MRFLPQVGDQLTINGLTYAIAEHPAAPGVPYGQAGRRAVVYQVVMGKDRCALKVFSRRFRTPTLVLVAQNLAPYASLPGLQVCQRKVLTPERHGALLQQHPDLAYAVLMPWIEGPTWMEAADQKQVLTSEESLSLARSLAEILVQMEERGLAHCDLSGPNVMLPALAQSAIANPQSATVLVDVEEMYGPEFGRPEALPSGTSGYGHRTAGEGLWGLDADRFAGAVLLAEMLGWCDERVRDAAWGENYFSPSEMQQQDNDRFRTLVKVLRERWGDDVAHLFERAWRSDVLGDCPTFGEWLVTLSQSVSEEDVGLLLVQAGRLEHEGKLGEALTLYQAVLVRLSPGTPLYREVISMIANLEARQPGARADDVALRAGALERAQQWEEASEVYRHLLAQVTDPQRRSQWQAALARCEEAALARLFDDGLLFYEQGQWAAAKELLAEVVRRRPDYERNGQRAQVLLQEPEKPGVPRWAWVLGGLVLLALVWLLRGPLVAFLATPTPTSTPTSTPTWTPSPTATPTATPTWTPTATPTSIPTPTSTPIVAAYTDGFDTLDDKVWHSWANAGIALYARNGALHAERPRTYTPDWNESTGIRLKQPLNFTGVGVTMEWKATFHQGAVMNLMYARVRDVNADRYLAFDCCSGGYSDHFACNVVLRQYSGGDVLWVESLGGLFTRDTSYTFKMANPSPRQVDFYVNGDPVVSRTFSTSEWNGMDWVEAEWYAFGWAEMNTVINASLDYFSHSGS